MPPRTLRLYFPGGVPASERARTEKLAKQLSRRVLLELQDIDPDRWPASGPNSLHFRLNRKGLTFDAIIAKSNVIVDEADENDSTNPLLKTIEMQPQDHNWG